MVRRYGDPVEVKARVEQDGSGRCPPDSFLWRGRLYVVRTVLGHWRERRAWWNEPAAQAVHGEADPGSADPVSADPVSADPVSADPVSADPVSADPVSATAGVGGLGVEREVWRVEASAGRLTGTGVYDLCHGPVSTWSLLRVAD